MLNIRKFLTGIRIIAKSVLASDTQGELEVNSGDGKLNYHNGTSRSPVLTEAHSATVTNKSIDADNNTITNIDNADIKSGAAIDAAKIANGTVSNTEYQYLDGVTSPIQTQLNNITGSAVTSLTGDVTGTGPGATATTIANGAVTNVKVASGIDAVKLADGSVSNTEFQYLDGVTSSIQTQLNGKEPTITALPINKGGTGQTTQTEGFDALAPTTTKGDLIVHNGSDNIRVAVGSDGQVPIADSTQTSGIKWGQVQGIKNYIANPGAESNTSGWAVYADAAGVRPVDGTGGSPSVTFTRSTTTPLSGVGSFIFTKDSANRQGQGASYDFVIDRQDQAKVLQISFSYLVNSGSFVTNNAPSFSDLTVFIYDITNSKLIEPSSVNLLSNSSTIADQFNATFQSSPDSTSYRLILHCSTTSTAAFTLKLDSFVVSPSTYVYGTPVTDYIPFTPTGSWSSNITYSGFYKRVGDVAKIRYYFILSNTSEANLLTLNLPPGLVINTSKLLTTSDRDWTLQGSFTAREAGVSQKHHGKALYYTPTSVQFLFPSTSVHSGTAPLEGSPQVNDTWPFTWGAGDFFEGELEVPIAGWSSSVQTSDQTDTRIVAAKYTATNTTTFTTSGNVADFVNKEYDTHGAVTTGSSWKFTAPINGFYEITMAFFPSNGNGINFSLRKNGVNGERLAQIASGEPGITSKGTTTLELKAGDYIDVMGYTESSTMTFNSTPELNNISIKRLSGPSAIAANETIALSVNGTTGITIPTGVDTKIVYNNVLVDTHSCYSSGTWTCPASGLYKIVGDWHSSSNIGGSAIIGREFTATIKKNGTQLFSKQNNIQASTTIADTIQASIESPPVPLMAGDTIEIYAYQSINNTASLTTSTFQQFNWFGIHRIGK